MYSKRQRNDAFYTTPKFLAHTVSILTHLADEHGVSVRHALDFSAGDGTWGQMVNNEWPAAAVTSVDIEPRPNAENHQQVVTEGDFLSMTPTGVFDLVGINPPFGTKGVLAKQFVTHASRFRPTVIALIIPGFRGSFKVEDYDVVHRERMSGREFFDPESKGRLFVHGKMEFVVLLRSHNKTAVLSEGGRGDMQTPKGFVLFPRTAELTSEQNLLVRASGVRRNGRCDALARVDGERWCVMRNGKWDEQHVRTPMSSGWKIVKTEHGCDWAYLSVPDPRRFAEFINNHPDPQLLERHPPSMRRSWIAKIARDFTGGITSG